MVLRQTKAWLLSATLYLSAAAAATTPFESCPTQAFLVQDSVPRMYAVDLSTGYVELLAANLGTSDRFNGVGFNYSDAHIYGWSYQYRTLARLGSDMQLEPIELAEPLDDNYFVGDVSVDGAYYYAYKRGSAGSHGLWRIALEPAHPQYLRPVRVVSGAQLQLSIYDFAFHPDNGQLYSIARGGQLVRIDPASGESSQIADLGEPGVYGAVYFDNDGRLYASRNTDGVVFQVDPAAATPVAVPYAYGPKSGHNDGARCALAPVVAADRSAIDFGDAPASYGTTLAANGARHNTEGSNIALGASVDAEAQAAVYPGSDGAVGEDDEDGVAFITPLAAGETALISVAAQGAGYLNAWIDLDRDGRFAAGEQLVSGRYLDEGQTVIAVDIPAGISDGASWARFRFSGTRLLGATGGAPDGEVEDHPVQLHGRVVSSTYYPSADGHVSLAFEDLWPAAGDYDMNDLVVYYRTTVNTVSLSHRPQDAVVDSVIVRGEIAAIGATLHSGFAVELTGIPRAAVDSEGLTLTLGGERAGRAILESGAGSEHAVLIVYEDAWSHVDADEGCAFFRTQDRCGGVRDRSRFTLTVPLKSEVARSALSDQLFNPFIFGADARRREVHLKNRAPTPRADQSAFGTGDDASVPAAGIYYQTAGGLPWAIVIGDRWDHPEEAHDLLQSYPDFGPFATSGGATRRGWHGRDRAVTSKLYQE